MEVEGPKERRIKFTNIDEALWRWLRAQAILERKTTGAKLNEILAEAKANTKKVGV